MKLQLLLLAGLLAITGQAQAGLFSDDVARNHIRQLEERISKQDDLIKQQEEAIKQQAELITQQAEENRKFGESSQQLKDTGKQQISSLLDIQAQIESQNMDLRNLRGQNEELRHLLQDMEKRQKDFYIDLDTRIRHFESAEVASASAPLPATSMSSTAEAGGTGDAPVAEDDFAAGNRAYEAAYGLFKAGNHQKAVSAFKEFQEKFPESVYVPKASFELASAYFALKDYKNALAGYQEVTGKYSFSPRAQDAMLGVADCQIELKEISAAKKTLKQIIAKYPGSEIAEKAKERLAALK